MSGGDTNINISPLTLERARKAKEAIEKYYVDMVKIKQERNERHRKIDQLLSQAALSEEEETKVVILPCCRFGHGGTSTHFWFIDLNR